MANQTDASLGARARAARYLEHAKARRQRAEEAFARAVVQSRSAGNGGQPHGPHLPDGPDVEQRQVDAEAEVTKRRIALLCEPRDQLLFPALEVLDPYFLAIADQQALLRVLLDTALRNTRADMGNVQLFDPASNGLYIAIQHGFHRPFLEFFAWVDDQSSACGAAAVRTRTVTIPDVTRSAIFGTGPGRDVVLDAQARAVQSIPLVGSSGQLLGVFSTHYRCPGGPAATDDRLLAVLARAAARALQWNASPRGKPLVTVAGRPVAAAQEARGPGSLRGPAPETVLRRTPPR
jgi:GAF domain-containing protein